jgi:Zn-finger nucleic acid-binding protein
VADKWDERKKAQEEEYFVRKEQEALAKLKEKQQGEAKESLQKTCHMRCPKCGEPLKERSFQKVAVDQCTGCHGIWLDAGEIDEVAGKEGSGWLGRFWQKNA